MRRRWRNDLAEPATVARYGKPKPSSNRHAWPNGIAERSFASAVAVKSADHFAANAVAEPECEPGSNAEPNGHPAADA